MKLPSFLAPLLITSLKKKGTDVEIKNGYTSNFRDDKTIKVLLSNKGIERIFCSTHSDCKEGEVCGKFNDGSFAICLSK